MNLIYLFSISLLTELTSILFETPPDYHLKETEWRWMREPNELATELWEIIR